MAEIPWQISVFLGPRSNRPLPQNFCCDIVFGRNGHKKSLPNPMQGGSVIRPFIVYGVTTYPLPIWVGEIFICPFLINSPTRFALRGITIVIKKNSSVVLMYIKDYNIILWFMASTVKRQKQYNFREVTWKTVQNLVSNCIMQPLPCTKLGHFSFKQLFCYI